MGFLPAALQKIQDDFIKEHKGPGISYIAIVKLNGVVIQVGLETEDAGEGLPETYQGYDVVTKVTGKIKKQGLR